MPDFWSKAVQKIKSKVTYESLSTISQETTESVTINDKTNPQPSTETPPSTTNQHRKRYTSRLISETRPLTTRTK